ncbi:putative lysozyme [Mycena sp. CBHHK59/15]|nr:putative lysozyme [Mycena sp. CBHHK59/15]
MNLLPLLVVTSSLALAISGKMIFHDKRAQPYGIDATVKSNGIAFTYIKATEGLSMCSTIFFFSQYTGATQAGLIRGGYHFAHPDSSSGATQANFFLAHGGGWSGDGITLPGALDIECIQSSGAECYGLSDSAMVAWITDFSNTYHVATTRPLWIARYASSIGTLPAGWCYATFWQYADSGPNPGDQDLFNGDAAGLNRMATG